jgi:hypothetical protein
MQIYLNKWCQEPFNDVKKWFLTPFIFVNNFSKMDCFFKNLILSLY